MPEILTESFCERCGTRYTFEATHQRVHLKGVKVLSRGLKNFVLSDDTSMDEAMASARAETDREVTSQQLDAFHQTFNFCMSCRQYTCPNCWNEAEARCLSCAPNLGRDVLEAPFPDMAASAAAFPGLTSASNGHTDDAQLAAESANGVDDVDAAARLQALTSPAPVSDADATWAEAVAAAAIVESEPEPSVEAAAEVDDAPAPAIAADDAIWAAAPIDADGAQDATAEPEAADHDAAAIAAAAALAALAAEAATSSDPKTDIRSKTSGQSAGLLGRFRPGRSMDAELAAYEQERTAALAGAAATAPEADAPAEPTIEPDAEAGLPPDAFAAGIVAAGIVEAEPEPDVAEPEPVAAEPEPVAVEAAPAAPEPEPVVAAPEPEPEPVQAAPEPVAADPAPTADVVVQPTWQRVAPDPGPEAPVVPPGAPASVPASATSDPSSSPQWPTQPEWPTSGQSQANGLPFLGRPAAPQGGLEALWAASSQELSAPPQPAAGKTAGGIQPCVSCGLSLSANARFCRRCGTLQGG
jgi:ribosomal protein L40E